MTSAAPEISSPVGVIAGGGWTDVDRKRHYGVPLYDGVALPDAVVPVGAERG